MSWVTAMNPILTFCYKTFIDRSSCLKNKAPWTRYPGRLTNQLPILLPVTYFLSCLCPTGISVNFMLN